MSSLTGECAAQKLKNLCSSSLWTCLHHMVILRSQNKITDFLMILAWASPFKHILDHTVFSNMFVMLRNNSGNLSNFHMAIKQRLEDQYEQQGEMR